MAYPSISRSSDVGWLPGTCGHVIRQAVDLDLHRLAFILLPISPMTSINKEGLISP